jgi:hypothetical protein
MNKRLSLGIIAMISLATTIGVIPIIQQSINAYIDQTGGLRKAPVAISGDTST